MSPQPGGHYWNEVRLHTNALNDFAIESGEVIEQPGIAVPNLTWIDEHTGSQVVWGADYSDKTLRKIAYHSDQAWLSVISARPADGSFAVTKMEYRAYGTPESRYLHTSHEDEILKAAQIAEGAARAGALAVQSHTNVKLLGVESRWHQLLLEQLRYGAHLLLN